jgi:hypothetical protein
VRGIERAQYPQVVQQSEWQERARTHVERAQPWVDDRLARRATDGKHAINDFLFEYYPYSPTKLATWHPGHGVVLEGEAARQYLAHTGYTEVPGGVTTDIAALAKHRSRLELALRILTGTSSRPAMTGCFGLHEWAMVYGQDQEQVRHAYLPLRVSPAQVTATVDDVGLRCTHIDAYRFFTPQAKPLNPIEPTRETQPDLEQPGCLHAGMDLYKYAFWFSPFVGSDLIMDCFENSVMIRELDMRASPYDMAPFGLTPVRVETAEGRREYADAQHELMVRSDPLRERLAKTLLLLAQCDEDAARLEDH